MLSYEICLYLRSGFLNYWIDFYCYQYIPFKDSHVVGNSAH